MKDCFAGDTEKCAESPVGEHEKVVKLPAKQKGSIYVNLNL